MDTSNPALLPLLKQYFGFASFRPLQEAIIRDTLAGKDVFALLPTGARTENVRKWNHENLSTYGIGPEHSRPEWKTIGRELVRLGYVRQAANDKFSVLTLTPEGLAALKARKPVRLTRPVSAPAPQAHHVGEITCDETLFLRLLELRKRLADAQAVPPHIILSDVSLRQMARDYPRNPPELSRVSGMSERKLRELGSVFLAEIAAHLQVNPRQIFAETAFLEAAPRSKAGRSAPASGDGPYDEKLFEKLRQVRHQLASERGVPAFVILHDSALRQMAREYPITLEAFAAIRNVGRKRAADFGALFVSEIAAHATRGQTPQSRD